MKTLITFMFMATLSQITHADNASLFLENAINNELRSVEEKARDINRKPLETLSFFGLKQNMTIIELLPGGGWYSKILTKAVEEEGHYFAAIGTDRLTKVLPVNTTGKTSEFIKQDGAGYIYDIAEIDLQKSNVDMVLTFRNAHNFNSATRTRLNQAVFKALKSGGIYGIVDHTKRHMEPATDATWRRLDPVLVIEEAVKAGFIFDGFSDIHARAEDALKYDTRHESLINESDRFTLKFRKP